jgi:uncharacterized protein (TIGR03663 family)
LNRWAAIVLLAVLAALALRLPQLDLRPMHNDEAVNAVIFGTLWTHGEYRYDPDEHHGPTLHYFTVALCKLTGAPGYRELTETRLRLLTALVGALLVAAVWLLRDALGPVAVASAACLTAASGAMVFYSRYWIHEGLLVLFTLLAVGGVWHFLKRPSWGWAGLTGVAIGLMCATKETVVFNLAAAGVALFAVVWWNRREAATLSNWKPHLPKLILLFASAFLVSAALFTSFGRNPAGLLDAVRTYQPWFARAAGETPHVHPWWFYFERLLWFRRGVGPVWTEGLVLILALLGSAVAFRPALLTGASPGLVRFLAVYTVALAAIYCAIPYKTPWCLLGFWHGFILLAGVGVGVLWQWARPPIWRTAVLALLTLGVAHLGWQAGRQSFKYSAAWTNPWVYAQTSPDVANLVEQVQEIAGAGEGSATMIHVITQDGDCWPLPWSLRGFDRVGFWESAPDLAPAPLLITSAGMKLPAEAESTHVAAGYFQLRPRVFLELHVERGLWEKNVKR